MPIESGYVDLSDIRLECQGIYALGSSSSSLRSPITVSVLYLVTIWTWSASYFWL